MNQPIENQEAPVTARKLEEAERLSALPRHFGRHGLRFEQSVYATMNELTKEYTGGYWDFFELSNGGFYMAPRQAEGFTFTVPGNGYEGRMSADAAGITACLFVLSRLSFALDGVDEAACEKVADHFHLLRDFVGEHAEAAEIFSAID